MAPIRGTHTIVIFLACTSLAFAQTPKELEAPNLGSNSRFGHSVSMDSDRVAIGAIGLSEPGRAFVFEKSLGWEDPTEIVPSRTSDGDGFGQSVSLSADRLAISSRHGEDNKGGVSVFSLDDGQSWVEETYLAGETFLNGWILIPSYPARESNSWTSPARRSRACASRGAVGVAESLR